MAMDIVHSFITTGQFMKKFFDLSLWANTTLCFVSTMFTVHKTPRRSRTQPTGCMPFLFYE